MKVSWGGTYQKNHPSGVVSEDDQANGDEAKSHHLVCPGGLEEKESSAGEMTLRGRALMEGPRSQFTRQASHSFNNCTRGLTTSGAPV